MKNRKLIMALNLLTGIGIILYWFLVFSGIVPVTELVAGYRNWFMSFPAADLWIAACALLAFYYLRKNDEKGILFGILVGSSLIFLGLYAFTYGVNTGLLFVLTIDEIIEIAIKVYCLSVGPFLIVTLWQANRSLNNPKIAPVLK